ncbi:WD_REPEATS_REGION domain-containing protein, partial [Linnemannia gamsii]
LPASTMSSPPPPTQSTTTFSDLETISTQCKRPLSQDDLPVKSRRIEDPLYVDNELIQAQNRQYIESIVHTHRMQRLNVYKQPIFIALMAKPSLQAPDEALFPLMDKVKEFLAGDSQVMLILGDSGAGKSTFNRQLEHELWQDYKPGDRIPLFINLPALKQPERGLILKHLRTYDIADDEIHELKQHRQFVLICDGYDESHLNCNLHTTNFLNRPGQRDTKLLITCRTQYLGPDYRSGFAPVGEDYYSHDVNELFQEVVIAPFSEGQIEDYVERYVPFEPRKWIKLDYMNMLTTIPNLMDLIKNPFLLKLCLEALPNVVEGKSDLSRLRVTRVLLYDIFVWRWLAVSKLRLQGLQLSNDKQLAFDELLGDGFEQNGIKYQEDLAAAIFQEQKGIPDVDYNHKRDKSFWKAEFFSPESELINILRRASLLCRVGAQYRFVHISILEYFYSCAICGVAGVDDITIHPLSQRNLVVKPSIIQFLAERVRLGSYCKQKLLALIVQSKTETDERAACAAACAAANAITILVKAGVRFNGLDLRGIRVPGADLSGGHFDSANLQEADLTGVNLTRSWIRRADFSMARMEGVQFGELPLLKEDDCVISIAYSRNEESFAVGLENGDIKFYNTKSWIRTQTLDGHKTHVTELAYSPCGQQLLSGSDDYTTVLWNTQEGSTEVFIKGHEGSVRAVAFSPCGQQLLSGGDDYSVRLWNYRDGSTAFVMEGHKDSVRAVAFSPLGGQIASASKDKTVRLWDSQTGASLFILREHIGWVDSIAYSPSGRSIISGGADGTIRMFDTYSGKFDSTLDNTMDGIFCVACSSDDHWLVAGDDSGMLQLWGLNTRKPRKLWKGHDSTVSGIDFSPNNQWIASSSWDCTVKLWGVQTGALISVFAGHSEPVETVAFSPIGLRLASGSQDKTVRLWDVTTTGTWLDLDCDQTDIITSVAYSADGTSLISGSVSGTVQRYDAVTGEPGLLFSCGSCQANVVIVSPNGLQIATAGLDNKVIIWSTEVDVKPFVLQGHTGRISMLAFSPDGQWIVSGSYDRTVRLWNARLREPEEPDLVLAGHSDDVLSVAFSPCGLKIVSGTRDGTIRVWVKSVVVLNVSVNEKPQPSLQVMDKWSQSSLQVVDKKPQTSLQAVAVSYSSGSMTIALGRLMGACLELWDEKSLKALHVLQHDDKNDDDVVVVVWSTCGQWIATGSNNSVWLWRLIVRDEAQEWKCVVVIRDFLGGVRSIAWRPSELEFVTGSGSGCVQAWRLVDESEGISSARLVWSSGYTAFAVTDAIIVGTVGLNVLNQRLLKQRGARDEPLSPKDLTDDQ